MVKKTMPVVFRVLFSGLILAGLSIIFTWFTLWRQDLCDAEVTWTFINEHLVLFAYSCTIIFLLMAVLAAIIWRPFLSAGIIFSALSGLTYAHIQKFKVRQFPLLPEDLQMTDQLGGMMEFIDVWEIVRLVAGIVLILIGCAILEHALGKIIGRERKALPWWEKHAVVPRATLTMALTTVLVMLAAPVVNYKTEDKGTIEWLEGSKFMFWNQAETYELNGFVIGFLSNLGALTTPEPEGYSQEKIAEIYQKYNGLKLDDKIERKPLDEVVDNIIFVMNESFYDPEIFDETYKHEGDVLPNLHRLFKKYPSGYMYSPEYGGNTANVEFAAFTSLTNYWSGGIPYTGVASKIKNLPGLTSLANQTGFTTSAIHAYDGNMYKRNFVYENMGFDKFIDIKQMKYTAKENGKGYVSDSEVYKEVMDILNDGAEKHMIGAVTMQNHSPYDVADYDVYHFILRHYDSGTNYWAERSFESLHRADIYLSDFVAQLDKLDKRTVMIFFGDHAAGILDAYANSDDPDLLNLAHLTPYIIYSNFKLANEFTTTEVAKLNAAMGFDFSQVKGVDLPTVGPNCLMNVLYDLLGVEKPTLLYLVDKVCEATPILAASYLQEAGPGDSEVIKDYEMINYDILSGKRYWLELAK